MSQFDDIARGLLGPPPTRTTSDTAASLTSHGTRAVGGVATATGVAAHVEILTLLPILTAPIAAIASIFVLDATCNRRDAVGSYDAFLQTFARSVSDFSRGCDRRRRSFVYQASSMRGRNAAVRTLNRIRPQAREGIFRKYGRMTDQRAVDAIVRRLGGYLVN